MTLKTIMNQKGNSYDLHSAVAGKTKSEGRIISIFHGCMLWIEKSVTRVTDQHHEACRVMPDSDPE